MGLLLRRYRFFAHLILFVVILLGVVAKAQAGRRPVVGGSSEIVDSLVIVGVPLPGDFPSMQRYFIDTPEDLRQAFEGSSTYHRSQLLSKPSVATIQGAWASRPTCCYAIGAEPQVSFCNRLHSKKRCPAFKRSIDLRRGILCLSIGKF